MPEQLEREPVVIIREILADGWDSTNTSYSSDPRVTTGWWDWGRDEPTITVTNPDERPLGGGETGYSYSTGDGRAGQNINGVAMVNCWAGTFDTDALATEGSGGGRLSPKVLAGEMHREAKRVLRVPEGTTAGDGSVELRFVAPGRARRLADSDPENEYPTLFRYAIEAQYGYSEES